MTAFFRSYFASAGFALKWLVAMSWHLWRIGTLRPAFEKMSDTRMTALSFTATYFVAGLLPHEIDQYPFMLVMLGGWWIFLAILFERSDRSSALLCSALGVSAIVDIARAIEPLPSSLALTMEVVLTAAAVVEFGKQPPAVKASGYRRNQSKNP